MANLDKYCEKGVDCKERNDIIHHAMWCEECPQVLTCKEKFNFKYYEKDRKKKESKSRRQRDKKEKSLPMNHGEVLTDDEIYWIVTGLINNQDLEEIGEEIYRTRDSINWVKGIVDALEKKERTEEEIEVFYGSKRVKQVQEVLSRQGG